MFGWLKERRILADLDDQEFAAAAAHFLAELNAIHAFREGNGRTQMAFMGYLAAQVGYPLNFGVLERDSFLGAMVAGFKGDERPLTVYVLRMISPA